LIAGLGVVLVAEEWGRVWGGSGLPQTVEAAAVAGERDQEPLGGDFLETAQVKAGEAHGALDDAKHRLDGLFAFFITGFAILALQLGLHRQAPRFGDVLGIGRLGPGGQRGDVGSEPRTERIFEALASILVPRPAPGQASSIPCRAAAAPTRAAVLKPGLTERHGSRRTLRLLLTVRLIARRVKDVDVRILS
jgi:hypothetical protein